MTGISYLLCALFGAFWGAFGMWVYVSAAHHDDRSIAKFRELMDRRDHPTYRGGNRWM